MGSSIFARSALCIVCGILIAAASGCSNTAGRRASTATIKANWDGGFTPQWLAAHHGTGAAIRAAQQAAQKRRLSLQNRLPGAH